MKALRDVNERLGKGADSLRIGLEEVKRQALCTARPNTRKASKLGDQSIDRRREDTRTRNRDPSR